MKSETDWTKMRMYMTLDRLRSELSLIEDHFLRSYSATSAVTFSDSAPPLNYLKTELESYRREMYDFFTLMDSYANELNDEYQTIEQKLDTKGYGSDEEIPELMHYSSTLEEDMYETHLSKDRHTEQTFTSTYELFEGTLRQCVLYHRDTKGINSRMGKNGREAFENYLRSQQAFPKNNPEWKRINTVYTYIHDAIKHNASGLPPKKFGQKTILNYDAKRYKKTRESILQGRRNERLHVTPSFVDEVIDDIIRFSDIPSVSCALNEYYEHRGALELPQALQCYRSFSEMFHQMETSLNRCIALYDEINPAQKRHADIKQTGIEQFKEYLEVNDRMPHVLAHPYIQKVETFYKPLQNRIKHNKGNIIPINDDNRKDLLDLIRNDNDETYDYFTFEHNTLQIHPAAVERFSEETHLFIHFLSQTLDESL